MKKNAPYKVGLEREALRLLPNGNIDNSVHPESFGDKLYHPYITTDFSESQLELITPPKDSNSKALEFLRTLLSYLKFKESELCLHDHSLPPANAKAFIADFGPNGKEKTAYREYLLSKYSLEMQLMSGVHYNFSIEGLSNDEYFHIIRNTIRYGFIFPSLFGKTSNSQYPHATSIRLSSVGYFPKQQQEYPINFNSLKEYLSSLGSCKDLYSPIEYYMFIRPKYENNVVTHLELRSFDLDPKSACGITLSSMEFAKDFFFTMLKLPSKEMDSKELFRLLAFHDEICLHGTKEQYLEIVNKTMNELGLKFPEVSNKEDLIVAKDSAYLQEATDRSIYESLETSTKLMIEEALRQKYTVRIIDKETSTIEVSGDGLVQILTQASITEKDSVVSYRLQEDKSITKKLLEENALPTPKGDVLKYPYVDYEKYVGAKVCIKPAKANYGDGISIIQTSCIKTIEQAIKLAFSYSSKVIVEDFFEGTEYRFFVIDTDEVIVCKRVPPSITGDGTSTITDLIKKKNKQRPFYPISYDGDGSVILKKHEEKFLRENSNVSTGGTSIDYTEKMPNAFKEQAKKAARSCKAFLCGVDIIIKDLDQGIKEDNYVIIETNYNPAILIHEHPFLGKRRVCKSILKSLGFACSIN